MSPSGIAQARELDFSDGLANFREQFSISGEKLIYLDGNSLGRMPLQAREILQRSVDVEWGDRLIRSWNDGWLELPVRLGEKIANLIGASAGEVIACDATSINLFKLAAAALKLRQGRTSIVTDVFNFPSDLYILQGIVNLFGDQYQIKFIPSADNIHIQPQDVVAAIDQDTALVCLTHVAFKSAFMYDMAWVTQVAHQNGALMLWDLSHSVGAVPVDLSACKVDLAVGCTYKYLNGGPGSPAFLYVRKDLQERLISPMWGWFGDQRPFAFDLDYAPGAGISRFLVGTPPVLSLRAIEPGLDLIAEARLDRLRVKSIRQTDYLVELAREHLFPLGFGLGSPENAAQRGSHVALCHPEGYRICRALIEPLGDALQVIPDFRAPDSIRLGIAPLYTQYEDIFLAVERMKSIVESREYARFPQDRLAVT